MSWVVAIVAFLVTAGCTSGAEPRQDAQAGWRPVASWSGRGDAQLETFPTGGGRLLVRWDTKNETATGQGRFKVRLHSADSGRVLAEIVDRAGTGSGANEVIDDHQRFYITVESAAVDWSIRVEEAMRGRGR